MPSRKHRLKVIRLVQVFFFVLIGLTAANHALAAQGITIPFISTSSLHALCPFGGVTSLYQYLTTGTFVRRIQASSFVIMWVVFLLALPFGALFCGWICPLGSFQEWIAGIGRKIFGKRYNRMIPARIDNSLRYLRYAVLAWVLVMTASTSRLVFADVCPYDALFTGWTGNAATGGLVLVGVIIIMSLVVDRPFCKYACPYGALLGFFNRFRFIRLTRNPDTCITCKQCDLACPMNLTISNREVVGQHQCIGCMKCTSHAACPVENTVSFQLGSGRKSASGKPSVFTPLLLAVVTFVVFFGGIATAQSLDLWKSTSSREPVRISQGAFEGTYDPADIRGAYVLGETSQYFDIPLEDLAMAFEVPLALAANVRHGDLEDYYHELDARGTEIGNGSVKLFVALYRGIPYEVEEPTYLLPGGVEILLEKAPLTDEQRQYILDHRIEPGSYTTPDWERLARDITEKAETFSITGNTTFQDLLNSGMSPEAIESIIQAPLPELTRTVQGFAEEQGTGFGKIREQLEAWLEL